MRTYHIFLVFLSFMFSPFNKHRSPSTRVSTCSLQPLYNVKQQTSCDDRGDYRKKSMKTVMNDTNSHRSITRTEVFVSNK